MNISRHNEFHITLISLYHYGAFGTRILSELLKDRGYTVTLVFFKRDRTNEMSLPSEKEKMLLIDLIKTTNPSIIGISTRSTFYTVAKDITTLIKNSKITTPVIWGGGDSCDYMS
ncbi:MAG: hypothetical protein HQK53_18495 [Oligoflexia bacterium]|nr:hypothetical protein [Oligoflexia bacterium]